MPSRPRGWPVVIFGVLLTASTVLTCVGAFFYLRGPVVTRDEIIREPGVTRHIHESFEPKPTMVILPGVISAVILVIFLPLRKRWKRGLEAVDEKDNEEEAEEESSPQEEFPVRPSPRKAAGGSGISAKENKTPPTAKPTTTSGDKVSFPCPFCTRNIKAPAEYRGKSAACPGCKKPVKIPK